jgi:diguanylate cyclase (GGDEF)-like protein/PAS domain S-box-containing protein
MKKRAARFELGLQRLLSRVPLGWRLVVAMAVLLVPLALLSYRYVQDKIETIESTRLEKIGLEYVEPLHRFMRHMADHRGQVHLYLLGDRAMLPNIRETEASIEQDLVQLEAQDKRVGERLKTPVNMMAIKAVWSNFKGVALSIPAEESFTLHTALIAETLELNDRLAEISGMVLDPRAQTYYLMDAIVFRGPQLGETIGQLRGRASGLLRKGSLGSAERIDIAVQVASIREQFNAIQRSLGKAYYYLPYLQTKLAPSVQAAESHLLMFLDQAERLSRGEIGHLDARQFFELGGAELNQYDELDVVMDKAFGNDLDNVIAELEHDKWMAVILIAGTLVVVLLVSAAIVHSVTSPVKQIMNAVDRLARGDNEARTELDTADEIGVLGRQFDRTMDERERAAAVLRESEARYKSLTEISSDIYWEQDEDLRFCRMLGKTTESGRVRTAHFLGKTHWDLPECMPLSGSWADHQAILAARLPFRDFEMRYLNHHGRMRYVSISGAPLFGADGSFKGYHGLARDVTTQKIDEQKVRKSEANLATAQSIAQLGSWEIDLDNPEDYENSKAHWSDEVFRILGYEPGEVEASVENFFKVVHPADLYRVKIPISQLVANGTEYAVDHRIIRRDGSERLVQEMGKLFNSRVTGKLARIVGTMQDITERKKMEQQLAYLAQIDTLTGIPNRHMLYDRLTQTLAETKRSGGHIACMFVDLDRFKYVNDTFGHSTGDKLLIQVTGRLRECLRSNDTVGRIGGDEFAVLLTQLPKAEDAGRVAQKIVLAIAAPFNLDGHEAFISASIGITVYPGDGDDADELLRNADTAMYRAKEQGRNNYQFYLPQMNERLAQRQQLETGLRGAIERQEFLLHYQPKVELGGGTISGFEALLRWQHPQRGLVSPVEFVPVLEDTGLIVPVGEWVLRTVCTQIKAWQGQGLAPLPVAVNMSARQFERKTLDAFIACIAESGVDPTLIKLELTESLLMKDAEETVQSLVRLKSTGVRLSVDDFGTGYSSLSYLKRFPLDELKIDRAFIRDVTTNPEDAEITLTIINLAHSLHLKVVAEGVETEAQLSFLYAHGCDEMQGYYFSKPLNVEDCTRMLSEGRHLSMPAVSNGAEEAPAVLLLDDSPTDLELMQRALTPGGYRILVADSVSEAFEVLSQHPIHIVISDHNLPSMTGVEFLARVRRLYPQAIRIVLSGANDFGQVTDAVNDAGIHKYLSKDWDAVRLRSEVREAYLRHRKETG